jgi:radical SAM protein with 4Fe4S-binding SPASM domain
MFLKSGKFSVVEVITCVNSKNIDQLEDMHKTLRDIGVNGWRLFTIFPKGRAKQNEELLLNKDLLIRLFSFIKDKRANNQDMHISYSEEGYLGCEFEKEVRDDFFFCGAGINVGSLLADGSYSACPSLDRNWIQGYVDEVSFSEVWETRYKNMRNRKWMRTEGCKSCKKWNKCNGSSLHLWDFKEDRTKVCHYKMLND